MVISGSGNDHSLAPGRRGGSCGTTAADASSAVLLAFLETALAEAAPQPA
ncbi:hypothetical protein [Halomonas mongoliensis]